LVPNDARYNELQVGKVNLSHMSIAKTGSNIARDIRLDAVVFIALRMAIQLLGRPIGLQVHICDAKENRRAEEVAADKQPMTRELPINRECVA